MVDDVVVVFFSSFLLPLPRAADGTFVFFSPLRCRSLLLDAVALSCCLVMNEVVRWWNEDCSCCCMVDELLSVGYMLCVTSFLVIDWLNLFDCLNDESLVTYRSVERRLLTLRI